MTCLVNRLGDAKSDERTERLIAKAEDNVISEKKHPYIIAAGGNARPIIHGVTFEKVSPLELDKKAP